MRSLFSFLAGASCLLLGACAATSVRDASLQLDPGSTKAEVRQSMGTPEDRQFQGTAEAWQYSAVSTIGVCEYTVVWFRDAKVTGISTYRNTSSMGCRAGVLPVRWEDAPDHTVEIRNR